MSVRDVVNFVEAIVKQNELVLEEIFKCVACGVHPQNLLPPISIQLHHRFMSAFLPDPPFLLSVQLLIILLCGRSTAL